MAAGTLPAPGTRLGPCTTPCDHGTCEATRLQAGSECAICKKPIGYENWFYRDVWSRGVFIYTHARCVERDELPTD